MKRHVEILRLKGEMCFLENERGYGESTLSIDCIPFVTTAELNLSCERKFPGRIFEVVLYEIKEVDIHYLLDCQIDNLRVAEKAISGVGQHE